jgi:hypothetical protein
LPFKVVLDGPRGWRLHAAARRAPTILGALLVCVGAIAVLPLIVLTISVVIYLIVWIDFSNHPEKVWPEWFDGIRGSLVPLWLGCVAVTAIGLIVGLKLLRGNRNVILFLRRFGYRPATHAVTEATLRVGDFWRVVTLDDDKIESLGAGDDVEQFVETVSKLKQRYKRVAPVVAKVWRVTMQTAVTGLVIALAFLITPGPDWTARLDRLQALVDLDQGADGVAAGAARVAAAVIVAGLTLLALWLALLLAGWVLSFPARLLYGGVSRGVTAAAGADELHVAEMFDIAAAQQTIEAQRNKVFGARLCVLSVNSAVWQQTVTGIADICAVPLIDISEPTENVMWEIEELVGRFGDRCVFIGDYERLQLLLSRDGDDLTRRLGPLLDGREILGYAVDVRGTKRFVRALSSTLDRHVRRPLPITTAS